MSSRAFFTTRCKPRPIPRDAHMAWRKKVEGFPLHSSPGVPEAPPVLSSKEGSLWEAKGSSSPRVGVLMCSISEAIAQEACTLYPYLELNN